MNNCLAIWPTTRSLRPKRPTTAKPGKSDDESGPLLLSQLFFLSVLLLSGFLLLIPLAFTSFDIWKKRLGKTWKRLHQLIYLIAPLLILHYAWSKKGDFFALQGEIVRPLIYGLIVVLFLIMRISPVRKAVASLRDRILSLFRKRNLQPKTDSH